MMCFELHDEISLTFIKTLSNLHFHDLISTIRLEWIQSTKFAIWFQKGKNILRKKKSLTEFANKKNDFQTKKMIIDWICKVLNKNDVDACASYD
jgi:hypothetical protein